MSETDIDTTLCSDCQVPVEAPKLVWFSPFMAFEPVPLCKDCLYVAQVKQFETRQYKGCPYKCPGWRPKR